MSRKQRILKKRYAIFCEGDTEYNYTEVDKGTVLLSSFLKGDLYMKKMRITAKNLARD